MTQTTQLRRYTLTPGLADEFITWWRESILPIRHQHGFSIDFAYLLQDGTDFVWAVSLAGDIETFIREERLYFQSKERKLALEGTPVWTTQQQVSFVNPVVFA